MSKPERDPETGRFLRNNQCARRHGAVQYWNDGRLPRGRKSLALRKELKRIRVELERSLSGNGKGITVQQELLVQQVCKTFGFCTIFEEYLKEYGVLDRGQLRKNRVTFMPGFKMYLSLLTRQNSALISLGINAQERERLLTPLQLVQLEEAKEKESGS